MRVLTWLRGCGCGCCVLCTGGQRIVDVNVILLNLGSMAAYLVIIGDVVPPLFEHLVGPDVRAGTRPVC